MGTSAAVAEPFSDIRATFSKTPEKIVGNIRNAKLPAYRPDVGEIVTPLAKGYFCARVSGRFFYLRLRCALS